MKILVINAGSSSLKYQVIDMATEQALCKGVCEKITQEGSFLNHKKGGEKYIEYIAMPTHKEALSAVLKILKDEKWGVVKDLAEIDAVGHRVLHGGEDFKASAFVDDEALRLCNKNKPLGPLHMPANILCMEIMKDLLGKPQVAVFDTSFHQTMPDYAYRYAIPKEDYVELQLRRYGFHGTSHKFVTAEAEKIMGKKEYKLITCHLGNGASLAAIKDGKVMDTSMGFTPLEGLVMGTRSGDLDPAVLEVIMKNRPIKDVSELVNVYLNKKSGMKGICGKGDMREVQAAAEAGDDDARLAFDMFVYRVKKYIGAYAAALNGVDCIVMTGGIGENSTETRKRILENMEYLGVKLDVAANDKAFGEKMKISTADSKVDVWVIPTNEELVIARDTQEIVNKRK
ncbi:MAG: acetate kinase [Clostridia bacterium]|nr:acetate kinase [Clostridia bacterium]